MTQNHFSECVKVCVLLETSWVVTPKTSWKHRVFERSNEFISFFPNKTPGPISLSSCLEADISALVKAMWQKWEDLKTISMLMEQIQVFDFIRWGKEYLWVLDILSLLRCNGFKIAPCILNVKNKLDTILKKIWVLIFCARLKD